MWTGEVLWNSTSNDINPFDNLIFEDQYIALSTQMPSNKNIYGLGEHIRSLKLSDQIYTLWNRGSQNSNYFII